MKVKLMLLGTLAMNYPAFHQYKLVDVKEGDTINDLMKFVGLNPNEVHFFSVNGQMVRADYKLTTGDKITFIPAISGG